MISEVITTAGLSEHLDNYPVNKRKAAIKEVRAKLRNKDATDEDWDDALDALLELAKDTEE
jgi:flavin-dependent dehydrogenase